MFQNCFKVEVKMNIKPVNYLDATFDLDKECKPKRWLIKFYGSSTLIDYLMPNPIYTYILNIKFGKRIVCI